MELLLHQWQWKMSGLDKFSFDQERAGVTISSGIGGMKYLQDATQIEH